MRKLVSVYQVKWGRFHPSATSHPVHRFVASTQYSFSLSLSYLFLSLSLSLEEGYFSIIFIFDEDEKWWGEREGNEEGIEASRWFILKNDSSLELITS